MPERGGFDEDFRPSLPIRSRAPTTDLPFGLSPAQVANINRVGRETRAAREAAEQFAEQEFRIRRAETDRLQQDIKLQKDRIQANLDLAELRGDVSLGIAGMNIGATQARFDAGRPQREATLTETRVRTKSILASLSRGGNTAVNIFSELFDKLLVKSSDSIVPMSDRILRQNIDNATRSALVAGANLDEVNEIRVALGSDPFGEENLDINVTQDELNAAILKASKARGQN